MRDPGEGSSLAGEGGGRMATGYSPEELRGLAERHAQEAERLLERTWISAHIKAQAHASLAVYYESLLNEDSR